MRKYSQENFEKKHKILAVDDESGIIDSLSVFLKNSNYHFTGVTNPLEAIELVRNEHFDLLVLDFIMAPIHGDKVVEEIRKFNKDIYILLLTGHKDLVPPLETIKNLDIQGYCEKSDKFDQLLLLIESGIKSIEQSQEIRKVNDDLKVANDKLKQSFVESIELLRKTVDAKDPYTRGHSERVAEYSVLLGKEIGLNEEDIEILRIGGLFHDIGKIGVPDSVLLKPGKLTDEEFAEIKKHPTIGADILSTSVIFNNILSIVKHHHEKYNGTGYPDKLAGENIPYFARIAAIADTFDAMTSNRPYRSSLDLEYVINEFEKFSGIQFDPELAKAFISILKTKYDQILKVMEKFPSNHY